MGSHGSIAFAVRRIGGRRIAERVAMTGSHNARAGWRQPNRAERRLRVTAPRNPMTIELDKDVRDRAIASLQRYFTENMDEPIGNIQAGALLHFFIQEVAPAIYNLAIADAQERLHARVAELDIECHEEPFEYWKKQQPARKR